MRRIRWTAAVAAVLAMVAAGAGSAPAATSVSGAGAPAANSASGPGAAWAVPAAAGVRAGAPGRPRYLGISITGRRAVLTWTAGRGLARIAGYRVYRDGRL